MKINIEIKQADLAKLYGSKVTVEKLDSIKKHVMETFFPGLEVEIAGAELLTDNSNHKGDALINSLIYKKAKNALGNLPGIVWGTTKIDTVDHWVGYARNGISYAAAKFLNHSEKADKYVVVRREPVPKSELTSSTDRYTSFLSADVKKYLCSGSYGKNYKDQQIDYKVPSYNDWKEKIVPTDITMSRALHRNMHDENFSIFSVCTYDNLDEVKQACENDLANIFNKKKVTWRQFIQTPTAGFINGETAFLSEQNPMYMLDIKKDRSFKVSLVKSDYETVIKVLRETESSAATALELCEKDWLKTMDKNNERTN